MQKAGRACAECARQGGETPSLRGPGIRGACVQSFGSEDRQNYSDFEQGNLGFPKVALAD